MSSAPTDGLRPSMAAILAAIRAARGTPRVLMATRGTALAPAGLLDDLVGDAGQGPVQGGVVEDLRLLPEGHGHEKSPGRGGGSGVVFSWSLQPSFDPQNAIASPCRPRRARLKEPFPDAASG